MRDFLSNRPKITSDPSLAASPGPAPVGLAAVAAVSSTHPGSSTTHNGGANDSPKVDLSYDAEGRVQEIRLTCRCGERITLRCIY